MRRRFFPNAVDLVFCARLVVAVGALSRVRRDYSGAGRQTKEMGTGECQDATCNSVVSWDIQGSSRTFSRVQNNPAL